MHNKIFTKLSAQKGISVYLVTIKFNLKMYFISPFSTVPTHCAAHTFIMIQVKPDVGDKQVSNQEETLFKYLWRIHLVRVQGQHFNDTHVPGVRTQTNIPGIINIWT